MLQINFSELPKSKRYLINNDGYIRQKGNEKKQS